MASSINASTTAGLVNTADTSGVLQLQTAGVTAISIDASQAVSFTNSPTVTGGTANGVAYLNGSKVLTTGSALVFDGSNLGVGANPIGTVRQYIKGTGTTSSTFPLYIDNSAGSNLFTFRDDGNLGIGTSSPTRKLDVATAGTSYIRASNTTNSVNVDMYAATSVGGFGTQSNHPLDFFTNNTDRVRIDTSGNLLVGTTSATYKNQFALSNTTGNGNPALFLTNADTTNPRGLMYFANGSASGDYAFLYQGAGANKFYVVGSGAIYSTSTSITSISDVRHKENIRDLETGLAEVISLRPRRFDWKEGKGTGEKDVVGFIAQEVEAVLPDLISAWKENAESIEEFKALTMGSMLPTLVKAIQEQQALITQLQADVAALKGA